jgi:hypothetical protein
MFYNFTIVLTVDAYMIKIKSGCFTPVVSDNTCPVIGTSEDSIVNTCFKNDFTF